MVNQETGERWNPQTMTWEQFKPYTPTLEPAPVSRLVEAAAPAEPSREATTGDAVVRIAEAYGTPVDPDEGNWRPVTGNAQRDLPLMTQERMLKIAHWLWEQNPLANWIIEIKIALIFAEGVKLTVDDDDNQAALDRFWRDPINEMALNLPKYARELAMFGEQVWPTFVDEIKGTVRLGYIDPKIIDRVVTDPENRKQPIGIITKKDEKGRFYKFRVIVNGPESVFTKKTQAIRRGFADGEAFYFRVNDLCGGVRGRSDLLHLADWLDVYEQFLFGEGERAKLLRALVWDLELKNATPEKVKERARDFVLPSSGGAYVHNDSEKLDPKTPKLEAKDTADGCRLVRNHILGGAGLPEHWYGGGGDVNRAAAKEMDEPTFKLLAMRQSVWKHILEAIGRYVLFKDAAKDNQDVEIDWSEPGWNVQAVFPELVSADVSKYAQAVSQVVVGCAAAIDKGLMQDKTAVMIIAAVAVRLGVEIDVEEELRKAKTELEARRKSDAERDAYTTPPAATEGAASQAADAAEKADRAASAVKEAVDVVLGWKDSLEAGIERLAEAAAARGESPEAFRAALAEHIAAGSKNIDRLVEALAEHTTRHEFVHEFKHGETKKSVTVAGKTYELTEKDATT